MAAADWTDIPDSVLEVDKPIRSIDMVAMRDNIIHTKGLIEKKDVSNVATIDFLNMDTRYDQFLFEIHEIVPATDNVRFDMLASVDGGTNWLSNYNFAGHKVSENAGAETVDNGSSQANGVLARGLGNNTGESLSGVLRVKGLAGSLYKLFDFTYSIRDQTSFTLCGRQAVIVPTATALNAIRFKTSSGNITGKIRLYGISRDDS